MDSFSERPKVESRQDLVTLIHTLLNHNDANEWPNDSAYLFLQALAGWLEDAQGFYANAGENRDVNTASWQLIADALQAATIYE